MVDTDQETTVTGPMYRMDIIINEPPTHFTQLIYQGPRSRLATMTDVKFLAPDRILAAHRYSGKLYHIQLGPDGSHQILDTLTLKHNGQLHQTEAFVVVNNVVYMICFTNLLFIIDLLPNQVLIQRQVMQLNTGITYHGIAAHKGSIYITPSTNKRQDDNRLVVYDIASGSIKYLPPLGDDVRVKSLAFMSDGYIIVIVTYKNVIPMTVKGHISDSAVRLYTSDFVLLDTVEVPLTTFDSVDVCDNGNTFIATGANLIGGYLYVGTVEAGQIASLTLHVVHDFPHGINLNGSTIAYTSYTTSGIHLINKEDISLAVETLR